MRLRCMAIRARLLLIVLSEPGTSRLRRTAGRPAYYSASVPKRKWCRRMAPVTETLSESTLERGASSAAAALRPRGTRTMTSHLRFVSRVEVLIERWTLGTPILPWSAKRGRGELESGGLARARVAPVAPKVERALEGARSKKKKVSRHCLALRRKRERERDRSPGREETKERRLSTAFRARASIFVCESVDRGSSLSLEEPRLGIRDTFKRCVLTRRVHSCGGLCPRSRGR